MNPSVRFFLSAAVLLMAGCGDVRTYPPGELPAPVVYTRAPRSGDVDRSHEKPLASPLYDTDIAVVHAAVARVCTAYFGHLDGNDQSAHRLRIIDKNFSNGDTETIVTLTKTATGQAMVDFESHGYGD